MRQVASEMGLPDRGRQPLLPPAAWYDLLSRQGCEVDIWRTTCIFIPLLLIRRLSLTGCRAPGYAPIWQAWTSSAGSAFLTRYLALLAAHYPLQCNGKVPPAFPAAVYRGAKDRRLTRWDRWAKSGVMKGVKRIELYILLFGIDNPGTLRYSIS